MTRPLPWHDTPKCNDLVCSGPVVASLEYSGFGCAACGEEYWPTPAEEAQIARAEAAWDLVEAEKAHEDRACARCNGVLLIERFRLCEPCTDADNAERQERLF